MTIDASGIVDRLERFPAALGPLVRCVSAEDARWKPAREHWSILEICAHVLDEEREDFRVRLKSTLEAPERAWATLNLDGVAERRGYNARDLGAIVAAITEERHASIA